MSNLELTNSLYLTDESCFNLDMNMHKKPWKKKGKHTKGHSINDKDKRNTTFMESRKEDFKRWMNLFVIC